MDPQNEQPGETSRKAAEQQDPAKAAEKAAGNIQRRLPAHALPIRHYLESTVVPVLMQALQSVCRERPDDPVEYVANYLLQHNPKHNPAAAATKPQQQGGAPAASDSVAQPAVGSSKT